MCANVMASGRGRAIPTALALLCIFGGGQALGGDNNRGPYQTKEFDDCSAAPWCPRMVLIPGGTFRMGSSPGESGRFDDEGPQRRVKVGQFAVAKYPITRGQWAAFSRATKRPVPKATCAYALALAPSWENTGFPQGDDHPVVCVSWSDAHDYTQWLSRRTHHRYRLLSEAEWEYAARAGSVTSFPWGKEASHEYANYGADKCCSPRILGRDQWLFTSPVGSFPPNAFGLYDMHGNVFQWVQDCYSDSYRSHPSSGATFESASCEFRVARGGVYGDRPEVMRSAARNYAPPPHDDAMSIANYRSAGFGLRVARDSMSTGSSLENAAPRLPTTGN